VVELTGVITPKTFPGRPNYESVEKGDEPENEWIPNIDAPICTNRDDSDVYNGHESNIRELQLLFVGGQTYDMYRLLAGRTAEVTGSLFHQSTGHHHPTAMLQVSSIEAR
jgi:hypothetical protein